MVCSVHAVNADSDLAPIMSLGPFDEAYVTPRLAVTHLGPVDLREFLRKTGASQGWLPTAERTLDVLRLAACY